MPDTADWRAFVPFTGRYRARKPTARRWLALRASGATWAQKPEPAGLPDYKTPGVYVQRIFAGKTDENVVYANCENSKNGDFKPYVYRAPTGQ